MPGISDGFTCTGPRTLIFLGPGKAWCYPLKSGPRIDDRGGDWGAKNKRGSPLPKAPHLAGLYMAFNHRLLRFRPRQFPNQGSFAFTIGAAVGIENVVEPDWRRLENIGPLP
jgi:hypothetical protein